MRNAQLNQTADTAGGGFLFVYLQKVTVMSEQSYGPTSIEPQSWRRKLLIGLFGFAAMMAMYLFGFPWIQEMLNRVYAADASVGKHVAFVAQRTPGAAFRAIMKADSRASEAA